MRPSFRIWTTLLGSAAFCLVAGAVEAQQRITTLPLQRGYYVAADTPCSRASNATLTLITRTGRNSSRTEINFRQIVKTGPTTYRVTEQMVEPGSQPGAPEVVTYEIPNSTSFRLVYQGASYASRFCAQSSLPQPWRTNDIRSFIK